jgi:hypothetical protein
MHGKEGGERGRESLRLGGSRALRTRTCGHFAHLGVVMRAHACVRLLPPSSDVRTCMRPHLLAPCLKAAPNATVCSSGAASAGTARVDLGGVPRGPATRAVGAACSGVHAMPAMLRYSTLTAQKLFPHPNPPLLARTHERGTPMIVPLVNACVGMRMLSAMADSFAGTKDSTAKRMASARCASSACGATTTAARGKRVAGRRAVRVQPLPPSLPPSPKPPPPPSPPLPIHRRSPRSPLPWPQLQP